MPVMQVQAGTAPIDAWLSKAIKSLPGLYYLAADSIALEVQQLLSNVLHLPRGSRHAASPSTASIPTKSNTLPPSQPDCPSAKPQADPENPHLMPAVQLLTQLLSHPAPPVAAAAYAAVDDTLRTCLDACRHDTGAGGANCQVSHQHVIDPGAHVTSQVSHQYIIDPGVEADEDGDHTAQHLDISRHSLSLLCAPCVIREIITRGLAGENAQASARILSTGAEILGPDFGDAVGFWQVLNPRPGRRQTKRVTGSTTCRQS
jgi:hypothetical protein